jgi:hypothetical protein
LVDCPVVPPQQKIRFVVFLKKSVAFLHFVVVRCPRAMTSDFVY